MAVSAGVRAERAASATPAAAPDETEGGGNPESGKTGRACNSCTAGSAGPKSAGSTCATKAECSRYRTGIAARACTRACAGFDILAAVARSSTSARRNRVRWTASA